MGLCLRTVVSAESLAGFGAWPLVADRRRSNPADSEELDDR